RRRRIDRHRGRYVSERNPGEERLHILQRTNCDPANSDFAFAPRIVRIAAHERRKIEGGGKARLAMRQQVFEPLVGIFRSSKAGKLPHRPDLSAIAIRMNAARVWELSWKRNMVEILAGRRTSGLRIRRRIEQIDRFTRKRRKLHPGLWRRLRPGLPEQ